LVSGRICPDPGKLGSLLGDGGWDWIAAFHAASVSKKLVCSVAGVCVVEWYSWGWAAQFIGLIWFITVYTYKYTYIHTDRQTDR
jgi:hypothetical protein